MRRYEVVTLKSALFDGPYTMWEIRPNLEGPLVYFVEHQAEIEAREQQITDLEESNHILSDSLSGALQRERWLVIEKNQLKQQLAEKDERIAQLENDAGLEEERRQRTVAYDELMGQAVKFAERLSALDSRSTVHWDDIEEFLSSPIVKARQAQQKG